MNENNKIWIGWFAFSFVLLHFTFIFFYAFPEGYLSFKSREISSYYVSPFFEQNWSMFAPCPYNDYTIRLKYEFEDGDTTNWIRPSEEALYWHSILRMSHHGEIGLIEANIMYWVNQDILSNEIELNKPLPENKVDELKKGSGWQLLTRYSFGNANYLYHKKPLSALVEITIRDVRTEEIGTVYYPEIRWDSK